MPTVALCECGCGVQTPIATRTRNKRGQKKGEPLRFINGHNSRLLTSEEQSRRSSFKDPGLLRFTGSPNNYVKFYGRHLHRVVAEKLIGRRLLTHEIVHHRDGNKWNNSPENLEVMTQSEHVRIHNKERWHGKQHDQEGAGAEDAESLRPPVTGYGQNNVSTERGPDRAGERYPVEQDRVFRVYKKGSQRGTGPSHSKIPAPQPNHRLSLVQNAAQPSVSVPGGERQGDDAR